MVLGDGFASGAARTAACSGSCRGSDVAGSQAVAHQRGPHARLAEPAVVSIEPFPSSSSRWFDVEDAMEAHAHTMPLGPCTAQNICTEHLHAADSGKKQAAHSGDQKGLMLLESCGSRAHALRLIFWQTCCTLDRHCASHFCEAPERRWTGRGQESSFTLSAAASLGVLLRVKLRVD